jgi:hypothetical protein
MAVGFDRAKNRDVEQYGLIPIERSITARSCCNSILNSPDTIQRRNLNVSRF